MPQYYDPNTGKPIAAPSVQGAGKQYYDPDTGKAVRTPDSHGEVLPPAPSMTANPRGEGTYPMWDTAGKMHQIPFSAVNSYAKQGFKFDTNPIKDPANKDRNGLDPSQAYQRDLSYATTGPGHEAEYAASDRNAPLPMQAVSGVVKGIGTLGKPVMDVVGRIGGVPQSAISSSLQAQTPMEMLAKVGTMGALAAPAAMTAPAATVGGLVGGGLGAGAGRMAANAFGMSPENTALMEDIGGIGGGIGGAKLGSIAGGAVTHHLDPLRDYRSPAISTQEAIGRRTTDILHPNPAAYRGISSAITENAPYIKDFAQSTGNKLGTPLDFAKASTGAGQEASNFFKENLIDPNAELQTPHGTIGEVHQRLGEINDELRPAYRQRTGGQELTALERKNLETERDQLNDTLYGTLSERSGLPVEQIQAINQRGGALQNVGDEADAAQAMRRAGFSGYTPTGLPMPFTGMERAMRLLNYVRGGPERVAGRQLGRVFNQVGSPAEPLPDPQAINNYRQMAERSDLGNMSRTIERQNQNLAASMARKPAGMGPTQPPQAETMSPEPQLRTMADRQASRRANVTQQREIQQAGSEAERQRQAENYATRGTRLERLRQKLKEQ